MTQDMQSLIARLDERSIAMSSRVQLLASEQQRICESTGRQFTALSARQSETESRMTEFGHHLKTTIQQVGDNKAAIAELNAIANLRRDMMLDLAIKAGPWLIAVGGTVAAVAAGHSLPGL